MPSPFLPWIMSTRTSAPTRTTKGRMAMRAARPRPGGSSAASATSGADFFDWAAARAGWPRPPRGVLLAMAGVSWSDLEGRRGRIAAPDGVHLVQDQAGAHALLHVLDADLALVLGAAVD